MRDLHNEALDFYYKHLNNSSSSEVNVLNRNNIKRIKKILVAKKEEYAELRDKFSSPRMETMDDD